MSRDARLRAAEGAAGVGPVVDPFAEVECAEYITMTWDDERSSPSEWRCWNKQTGEPVAVTGAIKRAMRARCKAEGGAVVIIDWDDAESPGGDG